MQFLIYAIFYPVIWVAMNAINVMTWPTRRFPRAGSAFVTAPAVVLMLLWGAAHLFDPFMQPVPGALAGVTLLNVQQASLIGGSCIGLSAIATIALLRAWHPFITMVLFFATALAGFAWLLGFAPLLSVMGPVAILLLLPLVLVAVSCPAVLGWAAFQERDRRTGGRLARVKRFIRGDEEQAGVSSHSSSSTAFGHQRNHGQQDAGAQAESAHSAAASMGGIGSSFDLSMPSRRMSSIAGMTALKAELEPVLARFRDWHKCQLDPKAPKPEPVDRNGILFTGPPGNGKSSMAEAIAGELRLPLLRVGTHDLSSKWVNETAEKITAVVNEAIAIAPCVLFIDEMDAVAPRRDGNSSHQEDKKGVNTLLQQIDRLRKKCVLLVGATNFLENMDTAVVRDGRFDFRIEIPWPDEEARLGIFTSLAAKHKVALPPDVARLAAKRWERRSAAFIENVVKRIRDEVDGSPGASVTYAMIQAADRAVSKRAGAMPRTGRKLSDLALLPEVKRQAGSIVSRLAHWDQIVDQGGTPPRGILLYGPPGTGKTELVSAMVRISAHRGHPFQRNADSVSGEGGHHFRLIVDSVSN